MCNSDVTIEASGHVVQIYNSERSYLECLEDFVTAGLRSDEAVIVIAKRQNIETLSKRLAHAAVDPEATCAAGELIVMDAEQTLRRFMVNGWPVKKQFTAVMTELLERATANGRKVRAFGEMVAMLWDRRQYEATVRLEYLWDEFCARVSLPLLCAYPYAILRTGPVPLIEGIHRAHSRVFRG